jgi:RHS repeat-associated protein
MASARRRLSLRAAVSAAMTLTLIQASPARALPAPTAPTAAATPGTSGGGGAGGGWQRPIPVRPVPARRVQAARTPPWKAAPVAWPAGGSGVVPVAAPGRQVAARAGRPGGLPVVLQPSGAAGGAPASVRVQVAPHLLTERAGLRGVVFGLTRADGGAGVGDVGLEVGYAAFAGAYGGDFGGRLRLVSMPACALVTPQRPACRVATPVPGARNDAGRHTVTAARVPIAGTVTVPAVYALLSSTTSSSGDYSHTSMAPSYSWAGGNQGGEFTFSYPLAVPPSLGGPAPALALSYSSGNVDGRTVSTNGQASWVGEGWELNAGYVERQYRPCNADGYPPEIGDLCWYWDNATLAFGGRTVKLFRDSTTGAWKAVQDEGLKIELLTGADNGDQTRIGSSIVTEGEYWRVTTLDGIRYYFGLNRRYPGDPEQTNSAQLVPVYGNSPNEPCWNGVANHDDFCIQAYRWNLDYVVDPRGNTMTYFYDKQQGKYGIHNNNAAIVYDLSTWLNHIDYGTRAGTEGQQPAPMRVDFAATRRCTQSGECLNQFDLWPDTPWDLFCGLQQTSCPNLTLPAFWNPFKLSTITTRVRNAAGDGYRDVDRWDLSYDYPPTGDFIGNDGKDDTSPSLWLDSIVHTGLDGPTAVAEPALRFDKVRLPNRVDWGNDIGVPPLNHYRVNGWHAGHGDETQLYYAGTQCARSPLPDASNNNARCFPQWYAPKGGTASWAWFHKYTLLGVTARDLTGGSPEEHWEYGYSTAGSSSDVLWHHEDSTTVPIDHPSWSDWRGYSTVTISHGPIGGSQAATTKRLFRGMDGDTTSAGPNTRRVTLSDSQGSQTDAANLRGVLREESTVDGGAVAASALTDTTLTGTGHRDANGVNLEIPALDSFMLQSNRVRSRTWIAATGTWRWTDTQTTYDGYGLVSDVRDLGDTATTADDTCTHTDYARDTGRGLIDFPSQVSTTDCAATPGPGDYLSGMQTRYDGSATTGAAPTAGLPTATLALASFSGTTPVWRQSGRTDYDANGRTTASYDALNRATTTAYTPASGAPVTSTAQTNPLGHTTTSTLNPARGAATAVTDANGRTTSVGYDALGRLVSVRYPRPADSTVTAPDLEYGYTVRDSLPNAVVTRKLGPNGNQIASYELYDGQFRLRQTQTPAPQALGGRVIADVRYDPRGLVAKRSTIWDDTAAPADGMVTFGDSLVQNQHRYSYDNRERQSTDELWAGGVLKWQTGTAYDGDRTTVTPPTGGTATTTLTDATGRTSELRQFLGSSPTGAYQSTTYGYDRLDRQTSVTDPAGNTWQAAYDLRGRRVSATDPDAGTTTTAYDDAGQVLTTTDARGVTLAAAYDGLGRRTELHRDAATGPLLAAWTYDTLALGQLTSAARYTAAGAYTSTVTGYDERYRPLGTTVAVPASEGLSPDSWTTSTTYRVDGSVATTTFPAAGGLPAETVTSGYDDTGLALTLTGQDSYVAGTTFAYWGATATRTLGVGPRRVRIASSYDEATQRLTRTASSVENTASPGTWLERLTENYRYDPSGNATAIAETSAGATVSDQCFGHDGLGELTEVWTTTAATCQATPSQAAVGGPAPYWNSYRYDTRTGNRTQDTAHAATGDTTRTYTYPAAGQSQPHTLSTVTATGAQTGTSSYGHDAAGNTTTRALAGQSGQTLTWDEEGHLATLADANGTASYVYTPDGNRLLARDTTGTTLYLGGTEIHRDPAGTVTATRYYGDVAVRTSGGLTWQAADNHGTGELAVSATDLSTTRRRLDPFGNPRGTQPTWPTPRGFVNGTADPTGLTHLGAREYDPTAGAFISDDSVTTYTDPLQMNGYAYAKSNPVTASDATGELLCRRLDGDGPCIHNAATPPASVHSGLSPARARAGFGPAPPRQGLGHAPARRRLSPKTSCTGPLCWLPKAPKLPDLGGLCYVFGCTAGEIVRHSGVGQPLDCHAFDQDQCHQDVNRVWRDLYNHVMLTADWCMGLCISASFQRGTVQISLGGVGGGLSGSAQWASARPKEQGSVSVGACADAVVGVCASGGPTVDEDGHVTGWYRTVGPAVGAEEEVGVSYNVLTIDFQDDHKVTVTGAQDPLPPPYGDLFCKVVWCWWAQ